MPVSDKREIRQLLRETLRVNKDPRPHFFPAKENTFLCLWTCIESGEDKSPLFALYFSQVKIVKAKKKNAPTPPHCFPWPLCDRLLAGWGVEGCQAGVISTAGGALTGCSPGIRSAIIPPLGSGVL
jgi:hypothetical protein